MANCTCCGSWFKPTEPSDLDFTTDALPDETERILREGGYRNISTIGKKYGTIQCVAPPSFAGSDATPEEQKAILDHDLERMRELGLARVRAGTHAVFSTEGEVEEQYRKMKAGEKFKPEKPTMCQMCEKRAGLCLHNASGRNVGGERVKVHCSRPGAHTPDPDTCEICIASRKAAAWVRKELGLNEEGISPRGPDV